MSTFPWNDRKLGFGFMRLPKKDGVIDLGETCRMVDRFLAEGFTYFDNAYTYAGAEIAFGETVASRHPRSSFTLTNKMKGILLRPDFGPAEMFFGQLERCRVDYFDVYFLHSLQESQYKVYSDYDCWDFCQKQMAEGRIRHFGISYHGSPEMLERILTEHPEIEIVQLQINYVDWDSTAIWSGRNYEVARRFGKDIVVMEPVKGGLLADIKPEAKKLLDGLDPTVSPSSFALRFAASLPGVKTVLSGMSSEAQMNDNLATFGDFRPLTETEQNVLRDVAKAILDAPTVPCTNCRYCTDGCPMHISIPDVFKSYNMILTFGEHNRPHLYYTGQLQTGSGRASDCIACGQCEAACPQHLEIIRLLREASLHLDK